MKAVILAGGNATRLQPLTSVTNKHLLPLYDKPIIFHMIEKLASWGLDKIMIVTSPHHMDGFVRLLGSGESFKSKMTGKQVQIVYGIQSKPRGLAEGLWIAKDYAGNDNVMLCLGDNVIEDDLSMHIKDFKSGAHIFLKKVKDPERFGIATVDNDMKVLEIVEKPKKPKSDLAVIGAYIYDNTVFEKLIGQPMSARGEYEITYINNKYVKEGTLKASVLSKEWFDVGTVDSLFEASAFMKSKAMRSKSKKK
jgi:glucose-1-phosphate thymidylyltransferase